jgi:hypothetical protein
MKLDLSGFLVLLFCATSSFAQNFVVSGTETFQPQNKKILLLKNAGDGQKKIILFQTSLRVNTDGSPTSYHPQDLRGNEKALNNICNAIVIRQKATGKNLCLTSFKEAIGIFEKFRDSGYQTVPPGIQIIWENVLVKITQNGRDRPCIFTSGEFKGYFGSLTALKNGLTGDEKGQCEVNNQVDPLRVPALVLVGGKNPVKDFGAQVGDLLFAYNPTNQLFSAAIIGDTGPKDNLGEGSVFLNMKLLGKTAPPANKTETFKFSVTSSQVLIAIIPGSRSFRVVTPYTAENISRRVTDWQKESGFDTPEKFIDFLKSFKPQLK